jgi:hypothetical protein
MKELPNQFAKKIHTVNPEIVVSLNIAPLLPLDGRMLVHHTSPVITAWYPFILLSRKKQIGLSVLLKDTEKQNTHQSWSSSQFL